MGYGVWLHGEGCCNGYGHGSRFITALGWISVEDVERTKKIIQRANLPISCPKIPLDEFLAYMAHDKKVLNGQLRLVLLQKFRASCDH
ncbi:3-dehydroquinate synthase family protein [Acinetobacter haemolyticus]|uniref:3-dehydroquinate synthase family protein n=1 Tax=Acinetobacter haemolyticus TaxID=29430 RepID=UPI003D1AEA3C